MPPILSDEHRRALAVAVEDGPIQAVHGLVRWRVWSTANGGNPADLAAYDPALFPYYHLCDAPAAAPPPDQLRAEARGGRLYPGEGGLWLEEFVRAFPPEADVAIEAPSVAHAGLSPEQRARKAADACRAQLASAGRTTAKQSGMGR